MPGFASACTRAGRTLKAHSFSKPSPSVGEVISANSTFVSGKAAQEYDGRAGLSRLSDGEVVCASGFTEGGGPSDDGASKIAPSLGEVRDHSQRDVPEPSGLFASDMTSPIQPSPSPTLPAAALDEFALHRDSGGRQGELVPDERRWPPKEKHGSNAGPELLHDLYQENTRMRGQLDDRNSKIVAALRERQQVEQLLHQALVKHEALFSEIRFLHQVRGELEARLAQEVRQREAADQSSRALEEKCHQLGRQCQLLQQRCQDHEGRHRDTEGHCEEAESNFLEIKQRHEATARSLAGSSEQLGETVARLQSAEGRARFAEQSVLELSSRLRESETRWRLEAEASVEQARREFVSADMRRQSELRNIIQERELLSHRQQFSSTELKRPSSFSATGPAVSPNSMASRRLAGSQPWCLLERSGASGLRDAVSKSFAPSAGMLSEGRVREQVELLDMQLQKLDARRSDY